MSAHRLVMRVIRENLAAGNALTAVCQAAARLLDGLAASLSERWHEDRAATRDLVEQIMALEESAARCPPDSDLDRRMIRLRWWAAVFLNKLGDSAAQAIMIGERLVADQERVLGPDHPDTLTSRDNLANAYRAAGRTDEAISLHEQALAARERVLGPDHPDTLNSRNNLAPAYQAAGRTGRRSACTSRSWPPANASWARTTPTPWPRATTSPSPTRPRAAPDEAISLHEQALAARERVLGPDHPDTLNSRHNLAIAYQAAGRTEEAISLHEQTLAAHERVLGPDHPDTLPSRNNLALAYQAAGRPDEAISLHEQTLAARERVLGPDHPDTLTSRNNLANAYRAAGRTTNRETEPQPSDP